MKQTLKEQLQAHIKGLENTIKSFDSIIASSVRDENYNLANECKIRKSAYNMEISNLKQLLK